MTTMQRPKTPMRPDLPPVPASATNAEVLAAFFAGHDVPSRLSAGLRRRRLSGCQRKAPRPCRVQGL
jgi:hypothetical protein